MSRSNAVRGANSINKRYKRSLIVQCEAYMNIHTYKHTHIGKHLLTVNTEHKQTLEYFNLPPKC
jgi:hypothetical protein